MKFTFLLILFFGIQASASAVKPTLTVKAPAGMTFSQYANKILAQTPFSDSNKYYWEIAANFSYGRNPLSENSESSWSSVAKQPLRCLHGDDFLKGYLSCLATSNANGDLKAVEIPAELGEDIAGYRLHDGNEDHLVVYLELSVYERNLASKEGANIDDQFGNRVTYYDILPMPDAYVYVNPETGHGQLERLSEVGILPTHKNEIGKKFVRPRTLTINENIDQVLKTSCCGVRGEWMQSEYFIIEGLTIPDYRDLGMSLP